MLEAGAPLNALVAEKIFGWQWWRRENPITGQKWLAESAAPCASMVGAAIPCEIDSDLMPEPFDGPDYSRSIAATVAERLRKDFTRVEIHLVEGIACVLLAVGDEVTENYPVTSEAPTVPLAICLAALKAVGA